MSLQLHATYTREMAIASFNSEPQLLCDNQFAVFPNTILCFITVGAFARGSYLSTPSDVIWQPSRLDYDPLDKCSWFPADARETWDRSGRESVKLRNHHILLRSAEVDEFFYVGEAHLGSYGGPVDNNAQGDRDACFSLQDKIPREIWLQCGGYSGWHINLNQQVHLIDRGDVSSFDRFLSQLSTQGYSHLDITRYEGDLLEIDTNPECARLVYFGIGAGETLYVNQLHLGTEAKEFQCSCCGIPLEYPACETVPHSLAVQIAKHFLGTGNLPDNVEWTKNSWDWDGDTEPTMAPASSIEEDEEDNDRIPF